MKTDRKRPSSEATLHTQVRGKRRRTAQGYLPRSGFASYLSQKLAHRCYSGAAEWGPRMSESLVYSWTLRSTQQAHAGPQLREKEEKQRQQRGLVPRRAQVNGCMHVAACSFSGLWGLSQRTQHRAATQVVKSKGYSQRLQRASRGINWPEIKRLVFSLRARAMRFCLDGNIPSHRKAL